MERARERPRPLAFAEEGWVRSRAGHVIMFTFLFMHVHVEHNLRTIFQLSYRVLH